MRSLHFSASYVVLLYLVLLPIAAQLEVALPAQDRPQLPDTRFVDDMRTKNLEDVLSLYTANAVFLDPEGHRFATPAALRSLYVQVFATYDSDYTEDLRTRATGEVQHLCGGFRFDWVRQPSGTGQARWLIERMQWTAKPCAQAPVQ